MLNLSSVSHVKERDAGCLKFNADGEERKNQTFRSFIVISIFYSNMTASRHVHRRIDRGNATAEAADSDSPDMIPVHSLILSNLKWGCTEGELYEYLNEVIGE